MHIIPDPVVQKNVGIQKESDKGKTTSFRDVLSQQLVQQQCSSIKVSAHAQKRMQERNLHLDQQDWNKINNAINKAEAKGVNNSLFIHGELALIVSVRNRTVISAMDEKAMKDHVFTNIDSAVIIK